jgi:hypothetical protein
MLEAGTARAFTGAFEADLAQSVETPAVWARRSFLHRVGDTLARCLDRSCEGCPPSFSEPGRAIRVYEEA